MKPFQIPAWRKKLIDDKFRRKAMVIGSAVASMEKAMLEAVGYMVEHYSQTGRVVDPSLNSMFAVSDGFYRHILEQAFHSAQAEKNAQAGKKRLSKDPVGLPKSLKSLEQVFRDRRYWPKVMKRSKRLTERLRRQYLAKLRKHFQILVPRLDKGELSPAEAKQELMESWRTSKSRVETIFRTETTTYFAKTQTAFFEGDSEIIGFLFDSVRDVSRTDWCRSRHGLIYRPGTKALTENTPALHWNCRSHMIALANTAYNRKLLEDPERDPAKRKVAPLPPGWRK